MKKKKMLSKITKKVMKEFQAEYEKNLESRSSEVLALKTADAIHDSIPVLVSAIIKELI